MVSGDLCGRPFAQHPAKLEQIRAVCDLERALRVLLDQQYGEAARPVEVADMGEHFGS
jgi:hypothetical protein